MPHREPLFPIHDDHPLDLVNVELLDVIGLANELNEGGHQRWHF